MIGTGRLWATSAISAPSVTIISTPSSWQASRIADEKVRQRRLGSVPLSSTRSRSARGARTATSELPGQSIWRACPSDRRIDGRVTWKSKNSSGSTWAITCESRFAAAASRAAVAALAASFQPANAATSTGERRAGRSDSHINASTRRAYRGNAGGDALRAGAVRPTRRS